MNPAERGVVKVTCGDWLTPPYITCVVGRAEDCYNHTRDALGTWFCVDLGNQLFTPNYYSLKNSDDAKRPLRNWNFEGLFGVVDCCAHVTLLTCTADFSCW